MHLLQYCGFQDYGAGGVVDGVRSSNKGADSLDVNSVDISVVRLVADKDGFVEVDTSENGVTLSVIPKDVEINSMVASVVA